MTRTETKQVTYYDLTGNSLVVIDGIVYVSKSAEGAADKIYREAKEVFGDSLGDFLGESPFKACRETRVK